MVSETLKYSSNEISELLRLIKDVKTKETKEIKEQLDKKFKNKFATQPIR